MSPSKRLACPWLGTTAGRLGNQLLQIAATCGVAWDNNMDPVFPAGWPYRRWFSIPDSAFTDDLDGVPSVYDHPATAHLLRPWRWYLQDLWLWWPKHGTRIREWMRPSPEARTVVDGRWQEISATVGRPPGGWMLGVHVRRGDNVTNDPGTIEALPAAYYRDAIRLAMQWRPHGRPAHGVLAVTDDPAWTEQHLGDVVDVVAGSGAAPKRTETGDYRDVRLADWSDLFLFGRCGGRVLSNSTFALAGHLFARTRVAGVPVRPSYWVGDRLLAEGFDPSLLVPAGWPVVLTGPERRLPC